MEKHFKKKPKDILVMDCVYLEKRAVDAEKQLRELQRKFEDQRREIAKGIAREAGMTQVQQKLMDTMKAMHDLAVFRS